MPLISIIIPVYGVEKYLHQCLDSVMNQTFDDWECILIDDGSPDGSGAICDEYSQRDSRFRVIHKQNGGVSRARNDGLDVAQGNLGSIDYETTRQRREENYRRIHEHLGEFNMLDLNPSVTAPFMYPFMVPGGRQLRDALISQDVFIPCLWPNVLSDSDQSSDAYMLASCTVPIPIDQRYGPDEMDTIIRAIMKT